MLVPFEILFAARSREGLEVGHYEEDSLYRTGPGFVIIFPASSDELQFCLAFFLWALACLCAWLSKKKKLKEKRKESNSHKRDILPGLSHEIKLEFL